MSVIVILALLGLFAGAAMGWFLIANSAIEVYREWRLDH